MLTRSLARCGIAGVLAMGSGCFADPDGYSGGGRALLLPMEAGSAAASDDAGDAFDGGDAATTDDGSKDAAGDAHRRLDGSLE
jgi:hypothetical protein